MSAMITHSGRMVDLLDVKPEDIGLDDIAHALSQINRFTGHTNRPYSVAEHSINVAWLLPDELKIYGLLHDAHEAYIGDISTPLKKSLWRFTDEPYLLRRIETPIVAAIHNKLGVPWPPSEDQARQVKAADNTMAYMEMLQLFDTPPPAGRFGVKEDVELPTWRIAEHCAYPGFTAVRFKRRVEEYSKLLKATA